MRIYSAAYIMPSGTSVFGHRAKHRNHLSLLERMMEDEVQHQIASASSMREAFEILWSYPTIGNFLGYQFVTDLNYSQICDFSEMEWSSPRMWCGRSSTFLFYQAAVGCVSCTSGSASL